MSDSVIPAMGPVPERYGEDARIALVLGGDARFTNLTEENKNDYVDSVSYFPEYYAGDDMIANPAGFLPDVHLGPVQVWAVSFRERATRCDVSSSSRSSGVFGSYSGFSVSGGIRRPIQLHSQIAGVAGATSVIRWPALGLPPVPDPDVSFSIPGHTEGRLSWRSPLSLDCQITRTERLSSDLHVVNVRPQPISPDALDWHIQYDSNDSVQQPTAIVTDLERAAFLNRIQVASGVGLGVGTSLLASMLLIWASPRRTDPVETTTRQKGSHQLSRESNSYSARVEPNGSRNRSHGHPLARAIILLVVVRLLWRRRRSLP